VLCDPSKSGVFGGLLIHVKAPKEITDPQKRRNATMPKRIAPLSEVKVRNAKSIGNAYKLFGGGLFLFVTPSGGATTDKGWTHPATINGPT
jgi:hypothetical protein